MFSATSIMTPSVAIAAFKEIMASEATAVRNRSAVALPASSVSRRVRTLMPAVDASTGELEGQIYVWTKNFVSSDGSSPRNCNRQSNATSALRSSFTRGPSGGCACLGAAISARNP